MKIAILTASLLLAGPYVASAADAAPPPSQGWAGSGEAGLAATSGNTHAENLNAKFALKYGDAQWKNELYASALRNRSNVTTPAKDTSTIPPTTVSTSHYQTTADRFEGGASSGYKVDDHSYFVGAARYERDDFSPYRDQSIASLGYGYQVLKNSRNELAFEVGGGYKLVQTSAAAVATHAPADSQSNAAARGKFEYKYSFNATTSFSNTYLVESTSANTFVQNDAGLQVKMTRSLGLKAAYEVRHNSDVLPGFSNTDQLLTTNLVYSF